MAFQKSFSTWHFKKKVLHAFDGAVRRVWVGIGVGAGFGSPEGGGYWYGGKRCDGGAMVDRPN